MLLGRHPLEAVWLYVADVRRAAAFYREQLGLTPMGEPDDEAAHFDAGSVRISVHAAERPVETAWGFLVFEVADADAAYQELSARGVPFDSPVERRPYGRVARFRDPDGHAWWIWESLEGAEIVEPLMRRPGRRRG